MVKNHERVIRLTAIISYGRFDNVYHILPRRIMSLSNGICLSSRASEGYILQNNYRKIAGRNVLVQHGTCVYPCICKI